MWDTGKSRYQAIEYANESKYLRWVIYIKLYSSLFQLESDDCFDSTKVNELNEHLVRLDQFCFNLGDITYLACWGI